MSAVITKDKQENDQETLKNMYNTNEKRQLQDTATIEGMQVGVQDHAKNICYQFQTLANIVLKGGSVGFSATDQKKQDTVQKNYLLNITHLAQQTFEGNDDQAHDALVKELEGMETYLKMNTLGYHYEQQLLESAYEMQLLLAMRRPKNKLTTESKGTIYTSSQHQFDIFMLIHTINNGGGAFINPESKLLFKKRDVQLIKIAAQMQKLKIVSHDTSLIEGDNLMKRLGIEKDIKIAITSRYDAESSRKFNPERIYQAVMKAFLDVSNHYDLTVEQNEYFARVDKVTQKVVSTCIEQYSDSGKKLSVEIVQGYVESALMELGYHDVARAYVLYRDEKNRVRENRIRQLQMQKLSNPLMKKIKITGVAGNQSDIDKGMMAAFLHHMFHGYEHLNMDAVLEDWYKNIYSGISYRELLEAAIMSTRAWIETHPDYSFIAARILRKRLIDEACHHLTGKINELSDISEDYSHWFVDYLNCGVAQGLVNPVLKTFDTKKLIDALLMQRDEQFNYLGLQTLYDRYFLHEGGVRYELPQFMFMRVAMGLSLNEKNKTEKAIEFYLNLSSFNYMSATSTLFNSGLVRPQLSSCFLTTIPDDLFGIYESLQDNAMLSKFAGGLGNDWTQVRGSKAQIKGTNGQSSGIIPFLNVADASTIAVNQGGKRKGATCAYLETWHIDIMDFLELRKNTGDDRRRTHDMNTANWIPDLFMERVMEKGTWTLFSPDQVPELHDLHGDAFREKYEAYEKIASEGHILSKQVDAVMLWRRMLSMVFETGHPWFTYKDPCNIRSPQGHAGTVHSSNLCTEITLNTSKDEIAVCNLGSINLAQHVTEAGLDQEKLKSTIKTAVRMLDNVIDINFYPVEKAKNANMRHRPVGLGLMGFQDALYIQNIAYESDEAVEFADKSMEMISYYALEASMELAKERGRYQSYEGSLWSKGILPIDSIKLLKSSRSKEAYCVQSEKASMNWDDLRDKIKENGMRNSNVMAIAPTATISNICGITQSIEPTYKNLYVKSNLSGEFTVVNPHLVYALQKRGQWDSKMVGALKLSNGSLQGLSGVDDDLKKMYKTAFELDFTYLIKAASMRAKWLDQSQSFNLYMAKPSGKKLDELYKETWRYGLKTTYYLRTLGATSTEKSSIEERSLNAVNVTKTAAAAPKACSIDDPDCEACQ